MVYIQRRERFNAAHKLYNPNWSREKNVDFYGKCANENFHGHNYILYVTVKGEVNPETGYVINIVDLKNLIREEITYKIDHKNLNLDVDFLKDQITSTENLTLAIWKILEPKVKALGGQLHCVRVEETENNFVEYFG